ncbi:hypothetical protein E2C01_048121 [Portunus trituberculatus]|uniref:Uncharacterized protein n=1 Tax=Portunus trituberculatus TaxID=210409 RepID=A0A5B7GAB4_PORTR|nr:hypothetical protein [Portunus trituberculatus]
MQRWVSDTNSNHFRENQHSTSSASPNWQRQNARGTSTLEDPKEGFEKRDKIKIHMRFSLEEPNRKDRVQKN